MRLRNYSELLHAALNTNLKCSLNHHNKQPSVVDESAHSYLGMKKHNTKLKRMRISKSGLFQPTFSDESHVLHQNAMFSYTL